MCIVVVMRALRPLGTPLSTGGPFHCVPAPAEKGRTMMMMMTMMTMTRRRMMMMTTTRRTRHEFLTATEHSL